MVVFDTSFIIDFLRGKKETKNKLKELGSESHCVATPSISELWTGACLSNCPEDEKEKILNLLKSLIPLSLDSDSAILAGTIEADLQKKGQMIEIEDIQIGAISKTNDQKLITQNKKHFKKINGLKIEEY